MPNGTWVEGVKGVAGVEGRNASVLLLPLLLVAIACGDRDADSGDRDSVAADTVTAAAAPVTGRVVALQLASYPDTAQAVAKRDSLDRAGWDAYVRVAEVNGRTMYRVLALPSTEASLAEAAAHSIRAALGPGSVVVLRDSAAPVQPRVTTLIRVNQQTQGMFSVARWALSQDRNAIIVMDDPAAVEAEPVPNGFFVATERPLRYVRRDSVWDAAPSPDWRQVAFGRAHFLRGAREDTLPTAQWEAFANRIGMSLEDVAAGRVHASGMGVAFGFARPGVLDIETGADRIFPIGAGWRVRWTRDGSRLIAGRAPNSAQDFAQATEWVALDPRTGNPRGEVPRGGELADVPWVEGPTIDISVPVDTSRKAIPIEDGGVESRGGWIRARGRILGPGVVLAATRGGRFIAALVPNPGAREYEAKQYLAVYVTAR
ncbi:MAG TPA: SPOR domain-containing protein [Gemmatimonadaceae bacterium]|nr:SPOR domain-containing protein [Gemmatimonadaceae bacterium]